MNADKGGVPRTLRGHAYVNGTRLYYEIAGTGAPLVLIHGLSLDTRMWDTQFSLFSQRYQVIRYDVRGFGRSAVPAKEPYSHHDDLNGLLNSLGIRSAHILGHSMGSGIAADFALAYPSSTDSLVSVGTVVHGLDWLPDFREHFQSLFDTAAATGVDAARERWLHGPVFETAMQNPNTAAHVESIVNDYSGWRWVHDNPRVPLNPPASDRLQELHVPTLIIVGEHDIPNVLRAADHLDAGAPNVRRLTIDGAGHMSNMEAPDIFNDAVLTFLDAAQSSRNR